MRRTSMYSSMWFMSIVALLVMDVRTGALQDTDIRPRECYTCLVSNSTACAQSGTWPTSVCPADRPFCATVAASPDFTSTLTCTGARKTPCSLIKVINNSYELTCSCSGLLCNAPFSHELRIELLNLTTQTNIIDLTQIFFNISQFANVSNEDLYRAITTETHPTAIPVRNASAELTTLTSVPPTVNAVSIMRDSERPKAEALKQEATVPSDDDEDEGEGSGTYEETKSRSHSASAPAAPSSFLPANDNSALPLCKDLFLTTLVIYILV